MTDGAPDVDTEELEPYLSEVLDADVVGTEVLSDGLNLVVGISTADDESAYVFRRPNEPRRTASFDDLESRYANHDAMRYLRAANENGLAPFTSKPGSPTRRELVARYEDATGIAFDNERFYVAHAAFVLATVWEDLHRHRVEAGAESDFAPLVDYVAMVADSIVGGEFEL